MRERKICRIRDYCEIVLNKPRQKHNKMAHWTENPGSNPEISHFRSHARGTYSRGYRGYSLV